MTSGAGVAAAAVILAGGRGSRLGGVRKADLVVGGRRLLDVVLDACTGCAPVVVVGEADLVVPPGVLRTREDPPFSGPASGLAAGLTAARVAAGGSGTMPDWVVCLGCDQPGAPDAVPALIEAATHAPGDIEGISATARPRSPSSPPTSPQLREVRCRYGTEPPEVRRGDGDLGHRIEAHRIEWMLAILRTGALAKAIADRGEAGLVDCSMRRLLAPLRWAHAPVPHHATDDIDTWEDHARWLRRAEAT